MLSEFFFSFFEVIGQIFYEDGGVAVEELALEEQLFSPLCFHKQVLPDNFIQLFSYNCYIRYTRTKHPLLIRSLV
jgi:hypothetical protein